MRMSVMLVPWLLSSQNLSEEDGRRSLQHVRILPAVQLLLLYLDLVVYVGIKCYPRRQVGVHTGRLLPVEEPPTRLTGKAFNCAAAQFVAQ